VGRTRISGGKLQNAAILSAEEDRTRNWRKEGDRWLWNVKN